MEKWIGPGKKYVTSNLLILQILRCDYMSLPWELDIMSTDNNQMDGRMNS